MRFFISFSAGMVWSLVVCGAGAWALVLINPARHGAGLGEMAASVGVLAVMSVLSIGGWCLAYNWMDNR
jgi:hypothetical protein